MREKFQKLKTNLISAKNIGMMVGNFIFVVSVVALLTSCSVDWFVIKPFKNTSVTSEYPSNKKGLVIVRMLSPVSIGWKHYSRNENGNYIKSGLDYISMTLGPGNYQILMLDPGIYSVASFQDNYIAYSRPFVFRGDTLSYDGRPTVGAFEVKSQVVSYVGDLEFKNYADVNVKNYADLNVKDNFEEAELFFKKNYPKINSPIIRNLARNKSGKTYE